MFLNSNEFRQTVVTIGISCFLFLFSACAEIEEYENTPRGNFEALWKIMDEHYCFFEYKEIDWNQIHTDYSRRVSDDMNAESLFMLMAEMLSELKDGHVNISSAFDVGRYWKWFEDYPSNYSQKLIDHYLGTDYQIAGGMRYKVLDDNIGYLRYADFSSSIGDSNLDYVMDKFSSCAGMIIDVRNNGGGTLTNSELIASRFFNQKTLVGYMQHKTGKGHNDFSTPSPKYIEPSTRLRYQKPVVVLTNRRCYSATNDFVNAMRSAPNVTTLGDKTGGGSGLPFSSELPNGWSVRFSACPMYDANMQQIEFGIDPDIPVALQEEDFQQGFDTLIESARRFLKDGQK
ncbi:MAG: S41 family peptidase [Candidatus Azobacteroides sp.]|nr:S41 family peptidase [Candidatus Azobacteroides sp.]